MQPAITSATRVSDLSSLKSFSLGVIENPPSEWSRVRVAQWESNLQNSSTEKSGCVQPETANSASNFANAGKDHTTFIVARQLSTIRRRLTKRFLIIDITPFGIKPVGRLTQGFLGPNTP